VPAGAKGTVVFPPHLLPKAPGVYEIRYHPDNGYDYIAVSAIVFHTAGANSSMLPASASSAALSSLAAAAAAADTAEPDSKSA
jgi:hypothetical protein